MASRPHIQMPSLIILFGPAAGHVGVIREALRIRLAEGVPELARVVVPTGDEVSQGLTLSRLLDEVLSRQAALAAHEQGSPPGRALRVVVISEPAEAPRVAATAKSLQAAAVSKGMGFICYPVFVDARQGGEAKAAQVPETARAMMALSQESVAGQPVFARVLHLSTQDQKGRGVRPEVVWAQAAHFSAWAVCPGTAEAIDRLLSSEADSGSVRFGSLGLVCYISDPVGFGEENGRAVFRAFQQRLLAPTPAAEPAPDPADDPVLTERLQEAFSADLGVD
ncbi:MAG: hypothetical protein IMF16_08830, partial [Proteobacteria bacterium]|nr:hypothetical protein [Pseudomonadota bacterium]